MAFKPGHYGKVSLGTSTVVGIGTWTIPGTTADVLEDTEFGDNYKTYQIGLLDSGEVSFNGLYDPADTTGQGALRTANQAGTALTSLRFYIDNTSYWTPTTTNPVSSILITAWEIGLDKSGLGTASFTGKVSGKLELI